MSFSGLTQPSQVCVCVGVCVGVCVCVCVTVWKQWGGVREEEEDEVGGVCA